MISISEYILSYIIFNFTYWSTCYWCLKYDDIGMVYSSLNTVFNNVVYRSIPFIIIIGFIIPNIEFNLFRTITHLIIFFMTIDLCLFTTHYLSHCGFLYKYHKIHHKYNYPSSITALYTHWFDLYFNNFLPVIIVPIILQSDWITTMIWLIYVTFNAVYISHSRMSIDNTHLIHHKYFNYNYGVGMYMDKIFRTYKSEI
jgi:sterol desaturase/sphingolipid hydroxylase (fatty acid hydroxylase superfamily)